MTAKSWEIHTTALCYCLSVIPELLQNPFSFCLWIQACTAGHFNSSVALMLYLCKRYEASSMFCFRQVVWSNTANHTFPQASSTDESEEKHTGEQRLRRPLFILPIGNALKSVCVCFCAICLMRLHNAIGSPWSSSSGSVQPNLMITERRLKVIQCGWGL